MKLVTLPLPGNTLRRLDGWTHEEFQRPTDRRECRGGFRPCPWVSCRQHLALHIIDERRGLFSIHAPALEEGGDSCALDLADERRGEGMGYEDIGEALGVSREWARLVEQQAYNHARREHADDDEEADGPGARPRTGAPTAQARATAHRS